MALTGASTGEACDISSAAGVGGVAGDLFIPAKNGQSGWRHAARLGPRQRVQQAGGDPASVRLLTTVKAVVCSECSPLPIHPAPVLRRNQLY
jgi:hypothetical protein